VSVAGKSEVVVRRRAARSATAMGRPLAGILAVAIGLLLWRRRAAPLDAFAAIALVFLLRCVLDPLDGVYYHVPFLLALLAWEGLTRRGIPVLTLVSAAALWVTLREPALARPALDNALYLGWAAAVATTLAAALLRRVGPEGSGSPSQARARPRRAGWLRAGLPPA
jgi:hypothetical protein